MNAFHEWVANTVAKCGGNRAACLQALQEKSVLAFTASRMGACQGGFEVYFYEQNVDFMRVAERVPTNLRVLH